MQHVKAHGALYNMAARDARLADAIARAIAACDPSLIMFGLPNSPMIEAGRAAGLRVAAEGFADRAYEPDGSLTPRAAPARSSTMPTRSSRGPCAWSATASSSPPTGARVAAARRDDLRARRHARAADARSRGIARRRSARLERCVAPDRSGGCELVARGRTRRAARARGRHVRLDARRVRRHALRARAAVRAAPTSA